MTPRPALRIAVLGGSVAGCAMALAAHRAGASVVVAERSTHRLQERGYGIAMPPTTIRALAESGFLDPAMPNHPVTQRIWIVRNPRSTGAEQVLWHQPSPVALCNWAILWQTLRAAITEVDYRAGTWVTDIETTDDGCAAIVYGNKVTEQFDLVIGADGYRSTVRPAVVPGTAPQPVDYVLWRGTYPESAVPHPVPELDNAYVTVVFPHGQAVFYLIPDGRGGRNLNWALYAYPPTPVSAARFEPDGTDPELTSFVERLAAETLPPRWAELIAATRTVAIHPIFDLTTTQYTRGPFVLAGDAGALARPHTASGAVKALDDARCFHEALRVTSSPTAALAFYDRQRCPAGNRLTLLGRRIGRDQIETPPHWSDMNAATMHAFTQHTLDGTTHYLYTDTSVSEV
ncbi:FAD-dependent monooxygenase [Nocardia wallacei]|uniref:FAD-dependent monooxygenase n=1 Tax=Nocardia wallacei TaxID=480035 RepID=UPI002458CADF|nr:FAD-dependent monooxygenase [Nocardia wallacei]